MYFSLFGGLQMSEESQEESESIAKLNQKIDDLRCAVQLLILFIIASTIVVPVVLALANPYSPLSDSLFLITLLAVVFIPAIIFILRPHDKQMQIESFKQT